MHSLADTHKPITVKFTLSYASYLDLRARAEEKELSLQDFIRRELFPGEITITPQDAVRRALAQYSSGEKFTVPGLFGDEWNLPNGMAGQFGRKFNNLVAERYNKVIRFSGLYDAKHHAIYERI